MTISKRLLALLMALAMCFALAACKDEGDPQNAGTTAGDPSASPSADPSAEPSESSDIEVDLTQSMYAFSSGLNDSDTAVTVNGTAIPNELFFYWLSYDCYYLYTYYTSYYYTIPDFTNQDTVDYLINDVQTAVTYYAVLRELCEQAGVTVTDEQLAQLDADIEQYGGLETLLRDYGLSEDSFRYVNTNGYLFTNYANQLMGEPTAADLEQYVADNGIFSVKHILLLTTDTDKTDDDGSVTQTADEYNAAQKELAEDLLAQLNASDDMETLFDTLMNEHSEDGGLASYPDGYTYDNTASLVDGFREAALELEPGELSGIVETSYGYHILLRLPVDANDYHDDWITTGTDAVIQQAMQSAEVTLADDIAGLDVDSFFNRYMAYGSALYSSTSSDN